MALTKKYFNIKLPFNRDPNAQYFEMNKTEVDAASDDLKLLLLTGKNERVMNPDYGVGLNEFIFEQDPNAIKVEILSRLTRQIQQLKNIQVNDVQIKTYWEVEESKRFKINENTLVLTIYWQLKNVQIAEQTLSLEIDI